MPRDQVQQPAAAAATDNEAMELIALMGSIAHAHSHVAVRIPPSARLPDVAEVRSLGMSVSNEAFNFHRASTTLPPIAHTG